MKHNELAAYVAEHLSVITNALEQHAYRQEEAADSAQAAYDQGQADAGLLAAQDESLVTNAGFHQGSKLLRQDAERARAVASRLGELVYDDE